MDRKPERVSFLLDAELHDQVVALTKRSPRTDKTAVLNRLIAEGLEADRTIASANNKEEYLLLKMLFVLRKLAGTREGFLEQVDQEFEDEKDLMKALILKEGVDYVGSGRL